MTGLPVFNQWTPVDNCPAWGDVGGEICGGASAMTPISEVVSVTDVNMLGSLTHTPIPNPITLVVNGRGFFNVGSPPDFSVSGNAITWLSTVYSVSPGDDVVASYFYVRPV
jgi:hypothetical protein